METISDQEIYNFIVLDLGGKKDALRGHARYSGHNRSNLGGPYSAGGSVPKFYSYSGEGKQLIFVNEISQIRKEKNI